MNRIAFLKCLQDTVEEIFKMTIELNRTCDKEDLPHLSGMPRLLNSFLKFGLSCHWDCWDAFQSNL
jgi:hypothetical protein